MAISVDEVRRIAELAKLEFQGSELQELTEQMGTILDYVRRLDEIDTDAMEPVTVAPMVDSALRSDRPREGLATETALSNAPDAVADHFRVPRILG